MSNNELYPPQGSRDRFVAAVMIDIRKVMSLKILALQKEQTRLTQSLAKYFDPDDYRKLNLINQHILVACSRRRGDWVKGNYPTYATIAK